MSSSKPTIRTFFAIDLPAGLKNEVNQFIQELKKQFPTHGIRWVKPEHLHITLQFLPEVKKEDVPQLLSETQRVVAEEIRSELTLGPLAVLPNKHHPHVIVLDILPAAKLIILATMLGKAIQKVGYEIETRPFRGHLTLGRIEHSGAVRDLEFDSLIVPRFPKMEITEIVYYQSEPAPGGSRYVELGRIVLSR